MNKAYGVGENWSYVNKQGWSDTINDEFKADF